MTPDTLPSLLYRLNQNTHAVASAIEEIARWIDQQDPGVMSDVLTRHLQVLADNSEVIADSLAELSVKDAKY
jgi:hypothetical protein